MDQSGRRAIPANFFAEVEQSSFSPANLVPGIGLSPDKMLMGRIFSSLYREVMNDTDRDHLVANIVGHASDEVSDEVQLRVIAYWASVDPLRGERRRVFEHRRGLR